MKITLSFDDGTTYDEIAVDGRTLCATDSTGQPVVMFGESRDVPTLRRIIEEGLKDEAAERSVATVAPSLDLVTMFTEALTGRVAQ